MHLLESLASFLAASTVADMSSSSNLPKPLSRFLAAGSGAYGPPMWERVGEVTDNIRNGAAAYGPPMLEKLGEVTNNVRDGAAAYSPPMLKRLDEVTNNVRDGAAAYSPPMLEKLGEVANNVRHGAAAPVWEKIEEATHNVHNHAAAYGPPMLERLGEVTDNVRNVAAAYGPPVWEKLGEVTHSVRNGVATHGPQAWGKAEKVTRNAAQWSVKNPGSAVCAVAGVGGAMAVVAPGIVSAPILSSAGFAATGVKGGSAAAAIHGTIGNVGVNSLFSLLQSAGASGPGLAVVNGVVQAGGAVAVGASGGVAWVKSMF